VVKRFVLFGLVAGLGVLPASIDARPQAPSACLHGSSEMPAQKTRRDQALAFAQKLNREENVPAPTRIYRPLEQLQNLPPTPAGFKLQFYTDGSTYTFYLLDTRDTCHYAVFSNQNQWVYEATPRWAGARVLPTDIP
jgi:hypothetical protein